VVTISEDTEAQVVATNTFDLGAVEVTKVVEGDDDGEGAAGPFTVELACSWTVDGAEREIDVPGGATRVLRAPDALDAVFDQLPVGAHCTITETEAQGADETSIEVTASDGTSVTVNGTAAELVVDEAGTAVSVLLTNVFTAEDDEGSPPSEDDDPPADGDLPLTGFSPTWLVAIALLAVAAGIVLFVARRRMDADSSES
jgi:LPXTG-motif cell wall-anchored protein